MEPEVNKNDLKASERQQLQSLLLVAVKSCQTKFGGRSLLATELDFHVKTLCTVLEHVLCHGLKYRSLEKKSSTIRQVTDLVLGNAEQYTLWDCIQHLLTNHERERYELLRQIWTDRGRARAWLRSAINERSLERYMSALINSTNLSTFYEDWSFLLNQESSNILPNMAAGLSSILFALSIDRPELNQAPNDSNLGNTSLVIEPIIQETQPESTKRKSDSKKHKKANLKIISFGDEEISESTVKKEEPIETFLPSPTNLTQQDEGDILGEIECAVEATCGDGDSSQSDSDMKQEEENNSQYPDTENYLNSNSGLMPVNNSNIGELTIVPVAEETHSSEDSISVPSFSEENEQTLSTSNNIDFLNDLSGQNEEDFSKSTDQLLIQIQKYKEFNSTLSNQLVQNAQQHQQKIQQLEIKINELNRENEVLKHQLRKYVNAVQLLKQGGDDFEGDELYQQKLVQVAEMHSELMELNERLQRNIINKETTIKKLYLELEALRGPLGPSEIDVSSQLISLWVPSVFLTGSPKQHHVYQVHIRVGEEEWNVYRRYSQFLTLHKDFKKQYPIISAFKFPPKKTIGNRDTKFVEERRVKLQQYLRRFLNHIIANNPQLTSIPNKSVLTSVVPLFGEPNDSPTERRARISYPRSVTNSPQYSGL
ncbi:unnamed protein product [Nezara viridula]|uniref:Sorting nexin-29 n=1 Tax=Nezara viridula TaxID=85310 RepID=A0A9P0HFK6_NEZVI|nr:unnamed protein product [Nezara viridula]